MGGSRTGGSRASLRLALLAVLVALGVMGLLAWQGGGSGDAARTESATQTQESVRGLPSPAPADDQAQDSRTSEDASRGKAEDGAREAPGTTVGAEESGGIASSVEEGSVEQVATRLLAGYRQRDACALASSGYLDLMGRVWGCVVQGDGWVDVCVAFEQEGSQSCVVRVLRLDAGEVGGLFEEE